MKLSDPGRAFMPYPDVPVARAATGPLADLSFAVKDIYDVKGYPTSAGSPLLLAMSGVKQANAPVVQTFLDAGARFVGKTISDELVFSMNGRNAHFGAPVNGAAPDRISGGSSSGSASAMSFGACDFALGSDTGGSVRAPASHCGLFGMRVSHGRVALDGAAELAPSFDSFGWFANDIEIFYRVGQTVLGADTTPLAEEPTVLLPEDAWALAAAPAQSGLRQAAEKFVAAAPAAKRISQIAEESWDALYWSFRYIQGREAWQTRRTFIERFDPPLGPDVAARFDWARGITDEQFAESHATRVAFRARISERLGDHSVLVIPTMPDIAPEKRASEDQLDEYRTKALYLLCLAGLAGLPHLSMPLAGRDGAPLGLSLIGPYGSDLSLLAFARDVLKRDAKR